MVQSDSERQKSSLATAAQPGEGPTVRVPGPNTIESSRVILFQRTAGNAVNVVYADNHTETLPLPQARELLAKQTGKTLEQLAGDGASGKVSDE